MPAISGRTTQAKTNTSTDQDVWKDWYLVHSKVNNTWRQAQNIYVYRGSGAGGSWQQVWYRLTPPTNLYIVPTETAGTAYWTPGLGQSGYYIYRDDIPNTPLYTVTSSTATSRSVDWPLFYRDYTFAIKAFNANGISTAASFIAPQKRLIGPPTPTITNTPNTLTQTISWNEINGATFYSLYKLSYYFYFDGSTYVQVPYYSKVKDVSSTSTTVTLSGYGVDNTYVVTAVNTDTGYNETFRSTTCTANVALQSPTITLHRYRTTSSGTWNYDARDEWDGNYPEIRIDWDSLSAGDPTLEFIIERKTPSTSWTIVDTVNDSTTSWFYSDSTKNIDFSIRVRTRDIETGYTSNPGPTVCSFNNGNPRTRGVKTVGPFIGNAQDSYGSTSNGQFRKDFVGDVSGSIDDKFIESVSFLMKPGFETSNFTTGTRNVRLKYGLTTLNNSGLTTVTFNTTIPFDVGLIGKYKEYTYPLQNLNIKNGTFIVDPFNNGSPGWSNDINGVIGSTYLICEIRITHTYVTKDETPPQKL